MYGFCRHLTGDSLFGSNTSKLSPSQKEENDASCSEGHDYPNSEPNANTCTRSQTVLLSVDDGLSWL